MHVICPHCKGNNLRPSVFKGGDFFQFLLFKYPLRCRDCRERFHVMLHRGLEVARQANARSTP